MFLLPYSTSLMCFLHFSLSKVKTLSKVETFLKWKPSKVDTLFWSRNCPLLTVFTAVRQTTNCLKSTVNTGKRCEICSKLTIKTPKRRHWHWCCLYCQLWTNFITFSTVEFEQVITCWGYQFKSLYLYVDQCLAQHGHNVVTNPYHSLEKI